MRVSDITIAGFTILTLITLVLKLTVNPWVGALTVLLYLRIRELEKGL